MKRMGIYCFFSGFDKDNGFPSEIGKRLRENIRAKQSLVFIASSPGGHEKTDLYTRGHINWFQKAGIVFEKVDVLDDRKTARECAQLIKDASAIFLCGGTALPQMEFIRQNKLIPLLRRFDGVMMGMSAGAINMAENAFYSADDDYGQTHIYKGIGLVDISVEPHFVTDNTELLEKELLPFSEKIDIYAMCDDSAIIINGSKRQYLGDIYRIKAGEIEKLS